MSARTGRSLFLGVGVGIIPAHGLVGPPQQGPRKTTEHDRLENKGLLKIFCQQAVGKNRFTVN